MFQQPGLMGWAAETAGAATEIRHERQAVRGPTWRARRISRSPVAADAPARANQEGDIGVGRVALAIVDGDE